jgi:hypothetical protein
LLSTGRYKNAFEFKGWVETTNCDESCILTLDLLDAAAFTLLGMTEELAAVFRAQAGSESSSKKPKI